MKNPAEKGQYLSDFERLRDRAEPAWMKAFRESGIERFLALELPHRKHEAWRFTNVNPIIRTPFHSAVEPSSHGVTAGDVAPYLFHEPGWIELVFINGFFAPSLSRANPTDGSVRAGSLADLIASGETRPDEHIGRCLNGSGNVFNALNSAFLLDGAMVHIPANSIMPAPVHVVFAVTERPERTAMHPRTLIVAERNSESTVIESYVSLAGDATYLNNGVTEIELGEGARMHRFLVVQEGKGGFHLSSTKVHQGRDSLFKSYSFSLGGKITRNELSIVLDGEGAETSLNGLYVLDGDRLADNACAIEHRTPHGKSWIGYKGVLEDQSHAVFSGKIHVHRGAQKTDSNQLNSNLLLSDRARVNTKPVLEILADDVKCTHGAALGPPPHEQILYFRTRGMSEATVRGMLTYGFAGEIVKQVEVEPLRARLDRFVFERFRLQDARFRI